MMMMMPDEQNLKLKYLEGEPLHRVLKWWATTETFSADINLPLFYLIPLHPKPQTLLADVRCSNKYPNAKVLWCMSDREREV